MCWMSRPPPLGRARSNYFYQSQATVNWSEYETFMIDRFGPEAVVPHRPRKTRLG